MGKDLQSASPSKLQINKKKKEQGETSEQVRKKEYQSRESMPP